MEADKAENVCYSKYYPKFTRIDLKHDNSLSIVAFVTAKESKAFYCLGLPLYGMQNRSIQDAT